MTNPGSYVDWNENPAKKKQNPACLQKHTWIINTCMQWQWIIIMIMIIIIILSRADILLIWDEIVLLEKKS